MVDPGSARLTTDRPEAMTSGLNQPSNSVGPTLENDGMPKFAELVPPPSSRAPAVITSGSSPGEVMVPFDGPELPADTTTTIPEYQAASTAWSSGSVAVGPVGMTPSDRLMTPML